jgi:DNA mismatch repair protein MSH6
MSMVGVPEMSFNMWASKFLAKGKHMPSHPSERNVDDFALGYKVGCVSQAETALGAEMRMAADKEKGRKKPAEDKGKDKIVRR